MVLKQVVLLASIATFIKILLIPSYTSTDFEVHRNWLAITHSLHYQKWYFENTSEWTLDYPPFFAAFEWTLSHVAYQIDSGMVELTNLDYKSNLTLYFQRASVIVSDFLLLYSCYRCSLSQPKSVEKFSRQNSSSVESKQTLFMILIAFNCGLFIVDHIHFQYNGFLFGIMFLSFANLMEGSVVWGAFWFTALLNFKHIYLYIAPAYGIYLFRTYCLDRLKHSWNALWSFSFSKFCSLAVVVISVFFASFSPFYDHLDQVFFRLFPFKRGLTHAYWAPNAWALYNTADKVLAVGFKRFGFITGNTSSSSTSGLVQTVEHVVLPSISPGFTFVLTFLVMVPCLAKIWFQPSLSNVNSINQFLRSIVLCSLSSYIFGWHVHEKAILMAILPFTLLAVRGTQDDARFFLFLQTVGHYSLFPLLFTPFETVIKVSLWLLVSIFSFGAFGYIYGNSRKSNWYLPLLSPYGTWYFYILVAIEMFCSLIYPFLHISSHFTFLPLMIKSSYCAIGVIVCWLKLYKVTLINSV